MFVEFKQDLNLTCTIGRTPNRKPDDGVHSWRLTQIHQAQAMLVLHTISEMPVCREVII